MLLHLLKVVIVICLIIWAVGFFLAHLGNLIHIALAIAVIALIWHLIQSAMGSGHRTAY